MHMDTLFTRNDNLHRTLKPVPGGQMSAVHFGDIDTPVKLVFLHATGFHGLAYRSILDALGVHVIALDLRGHGGTDLPTNIDKIASFHTYAEDVGAYLDAHVPERVLLSGHSLGASCAILAASKAPDKISKVLAFDPVVLPFPIRMIMASKFGRRRLQETFPLARMAGRRRDIFSSLEAAYKRFHGRGPFKHFSNEALWDYVCGGFVEQGGEETGVRLTCRPKWEQFTYTAQGHNLKSAIGTLPADSRILITDFVKPVSWIAPMQKKCPHISIEPHMELEHFFPLINPEISIPALLDMLKD
ncbi:MAG: hypothetical protein COA69_09945 [Robiginitomaculum sp.]|nr:MAG: hypothetical protein COA69_09945 [Robiginitomaculum sp.]